MRCTTWCAIGSPPVTPPTWRRRSPQPFPGRSARSSCASSSTARRRCSGPRCSRRSAACSRAAPSRSAVAALVAGVVAADRIGHAGSKGAVFRAGLFTGLATAVVLASFALFQGRFWSLETLATMLGGVAGGALLLPLCALLVSPLLEALFGYAIGHQAARAGQPQPPGAQGADRPGAGHVPPLHHHRRAGGGRGARRSAPTRCSREVCAYYHDIGKGKNPLYFGENQKGENRHDALAPAMSAVIIKRHVTDGHGDGAPVPSCRAGGRRHPAAPRHAAGRLLLPQGQGGAGGQRRRPRRSTRRSSATRARSRSRARRRW